MTRAHDAFPAKHPTGPKEGRTLIFPVYATDWAWWSHTFAQVLRNRARCVLAWNLLLNEKGKPNTGPFSCGGLVTVNSETQQLTRSGMYRAFAHYVKLIHRRAHIVASEDVPGIDHVVTENPDGSRSLVITNPGLEQHVQCILASRAMNLALPPDSITSLVW